MRVRTLRDQLVHFIRCYEWANRKKEFYVNGKEIEGGDTAQRDKVWERLNGQSR